MNVATISSPPRLRDHEHELIKPWFEALGLNQSSSEWATAWTALTHAKLAGHHGLIVWPPEQASGKHVVDESRLTHTEATRKLQLALATAANYTARAPRLVPEGQLPVDAGVAVEVFLALTDQVTDLLPHALGTSLEVAVSDMLYEMEHRVVGVYVDARATLAATLAAARTGTFSMAAGRATAWPPLVELVLTEALQDDVFTEHVLMCMHERGVTGLGVVCLPDTHWLLFRK